jgi:hypothetical protein
MVDSDAFSWAVLARGGRLEAAAHSEMALDFGP